MSTLETVSTILGMAALSTAAALLVTTPLPTPDRSGAEKQAIYQAAAERHAARKALSGFDPLLVTASIAPPSALAPAEAAPHEQTEVGGAPDWASSSSEPATDLLAAATTMVALETAAFPPAPAKAIEPTDASEVAGPAPLPLAPPVTVAAVETTKVETPAAQEAPRGPTETCNETITTSKPTTKKATLRRQKIGARKKSASARQARQNGRDKHQKYYFKGSFHSLFRGKVRT